MFSEKYNLGRLEKVTDRYFNDGEDVYTTIEKDTPTPTFPPVAAPTAVPEIPPTRSPEEMNRTTINATITFIPPDEAKEMDLPGAISWNNEDIYDSASADSGGPRPDEGSGSDGDGGSGSNEASEATTTKGPESEQEESSGSDEASETPEARRGPSVVPVQPPSNPHPSHLVEVVQLPLGQT